MALRFSLTALLISGVVLVGCGDSSPPKTQPIPSADGSGQAEGPEGKSTSAVPVVKEGSPEPGVPQSAKGQPEDEAVPGATRVDNPYPQPKNEKQEVKASFAKAIVAIRSGDPQVICASVILARSLRDKGCEASVKYITPQITKKNRASVAASYNIALERLKVAKVKVRGDKADIIFGEVGYGNRVKVLKQNGTWRPVWG